VSIQAYLGYSTTPVVAQFTASVIKKDDFEVEFFLESCDYLVPDVNNKVYFEVYALQTNGEKMFIEFTGAQLLKDSSIVIDYIQHWHNGKSFFEYTPKIGDVYKLRVYRNFAEGQQTSKDFNIEL
jgi:hypothetical protein